MKLWRNAKLRKEIIKKNLKIIAEKKGKIRPSGMYNVMMPGKTLDKKDINAKAEEMMNDQKRLERHKRALAIRDDVDKKTAIIKELRDEYQACTGKAFGNAGFARVAYLMMDASGTPEAKKKNMEYMISLADPSFAQAEFLKITKKVMDFDFTKLAFKDEDDLLTFAEENPDIYSIMFAYSDFLGNGHLDVDPVVMNFVDKNLSLIQMGGSVTSSVLRMSSNSYITVPDLEISSCMSQPIGNRLSEVMVPYAGKIDGINVLRGQDKNVGAYLGGAVVDSKATDNLDRKVLFDNGTVPKDVMKNYVCLENGKEVKTDDAINDVLSKKEVTFRKRTPEEQKAFDEAFEKPVKKDQPENTTKEYLIGEYETMRSRKDQMQKTYETLSGYYTDLKKAKHWYSWNHKEYKNLRNALGAFLKKNSDVLHASNADYQKELKNVSDLALAYVAKKIDTDRNTICQQRFAISSNISRLVAGHEETMSSYVWNGPKKPLDIEDMTMDNDGDSSFSIENGAPEKDNSLLITKD